MRALGETVGAGLGEADERGSVLSRRIHRLLDERTRDAIEAAPAAAPPPELAAAFGEAKRWFGQRHEFVRQLKALCGELSEGLVELSEDETWSRGQCEALRLHLGNEIDVRGLRAASAMLADTRARQANAKRGREAARSALKQLLAGMIGEAGALQQHAGGFESAIERHAAADRVSRTQRANCSGTTPAAQAAAQAARISRRRAESLSATITASSPSERAKHTELPRAYSTAQPPRTARSTSPASGSSAMWPKPVK